MNLHNILIYNHSKLKLYLYYRKVCRIFALYSIRDMLKNKVMTILEDIKVVRDGLKTRIDQLSTHIAEYRKDNDYESANKSDMKRRSFDLVLCELNLIIKNHE